MPLPTRELESPKVARFSELAGVAIGLGLGILLGGNFKDSGRRGAGIGLLVAGVARSIPGIVRLVDMQINRDGSQRSMRNKLASIRQDSGFQSEAEMF